MCKSSNFCDRELSLLFLDFNALWLLRYVVDIPKKYIVKVGQLKYLTGQWILQIELWRWTDNERILNNLMNKKNIFFNLENGECMLEIHKNDLVECCHKLLLTVYHKSDSRQRTGILFLRYFRSLYLILDQILQVPSFFLQGSFNPAEKIHYTAVMRNTKETC